jgi:hypothetical protein
LPAFKPAQNQFGFLRNRIKEEIMTTQNCKKLKKLILIMYQAYKSSIITLFILAISLTSFSQPVKVSENGRYLVDKEGKPFFYLGDTGWLLFNKLTREEAVQYLQNRVEKGFTVIQASIIMGKEDGLNAYGHKPLINNDPTRPNEKYFEHVDYVVDQAAALGLVIGMVPTWGTYWSSMFRSRNIFNPENAEVYGRYLGKRYKDKPLIWILGGDKNILNDQERAIIEAMAAGLKAGDEGEHLITFHPRGPGFSSDYFHDAPWLDFNMYQSSHASRDHDTGLFAANDYALKPAKPTLDGEPRYELVQVGFYMKGSHQLIRFDDYDCRQAAYWSILSGACGHTYGNSPVYQMHDPEKKPADFSHILPISWKEAIDHPGAFQMGHLKKLFTSRAWEKLVPNTEIINGPNFGGAKVKAALASDGSFLIAYSPRGEPFSIDRDELKGNAWRTKWFDPRYGLEYVIQSSDVGKSIQTYTPPTSGRGQDWVLIIEAVK